MGVPQRSLSLHTGHVREFPLWRVRRKSLRMGELPLHDLCVAVVSDPAPDAVIRAEQISGLVPLISSRMDTMWPSQEAAARVMERQS